MVFGDITVYEKSAISRPSEGNAGKLMISDEALMLDFQRGSREAFEELFARYRGPLHGFFRRRLESNERADDLTQETFLALVRAALRYEPRAQFRTYLYGIALKLLAAERRKHKTTPLEEMDQEPAVDDPADKTLWVRQSLARLDGAEREILMLREYEQLSYVEISELLRLPLNTVRTRLFRARMALKGYLEPEQKIRSATAPELRNKDEI
jgi:RNA polymerase sigma-70 factor, ECF subfamily